MRNVMRISIVASLLALPLGASAQTPTIGTVTDPGGNPLPGNCELYAVKSDGGMNNDWQAHLFAKGGGGVGLGMLDFDQNTGTYQVLAGNFTRPEAPSNVVASFVTCPNGQLHFDSGSLVEFNFMGSAHLQTVGNSYTGDLTLPGDASAYDVDFGNGAVQFPAIGANAAADTGQSINYAFAPVAELAPFAGGDCSATNDGTCYNDPWRGCCPDPGSTIPSGGFIIGYNVYRMVNDGSGAPDAATLGAMSNWAGFMPMDFDQTVGDGGGMDMDAPADNNAAGDFTGMQNADAAAYTGDEILLYQDGMNVARDGATMNPRPADPTVAYWYAVQPVVRGSVADFANVQLAGTPAADYALDLDTDGTDDWVDLDLDGSPDFYSPNENAGIPGLGLTFGGAPLLSPVAASDPTRLPATDYLGLDVEMGRRGVSLSLNAALEAGNVLGYNVYRTVGDVRELVNDSLIAARGGNGNTYEIVDERFTGRRARSLSYEVEVVYNDGTPAATFGPFQAEETVRGSNRR